MRPLSLWIQRLEKLGTKENLDFQSVYTALGGIRDFNDQVAFVRKFAELDSDFRITLRDYARKEYRRTGDNEIEIEWIKAIQVVEGELDIQKSNWKW